MKKRVSFVSNSSSSSFIIYDWNLVPDFKKDMILNFKKHVAELWNNKGLPVSYEYNSPHIAFDSIAEDNMAEANEFDFGWIDEWRFRESGNNLEAVTSMDNFNLKKWLDYVGGIKYADTGETWGFFSDEKVEADFSWMTNEDVK